MNKEINALGENRTWVLTELLEGQKAIGSKCIFKTKLNPDGNVERYKAMLVASGYKRMEGLDFNQTFSPVIKLATVRIIIALATVKHWLICQLNVNNAFLNGHQDEEAYILLPSSYTKAKNGQFCKLEKSLYGLKQAPRQWYTDLTNFLIRIGFV